MMARSVSETLEQSWSTADKPVVASRCRHHRVIRGGTIAKRFSLSNLQKPPKQLGALSGLQRPVRSGGKARHRGAVSYHLVGSRGRRVRRRWPHLSQKPHGASGIGRREPLNGRGVRGQAVDKLAALAGVEE